MRETWKSSDAKVKGSDTRFFVFFFVYSAIFQQFAINCILFRQCVYNLNDQAFDHSLCLYSIFRVEIPRIFAAFDLLPFVA